MGSAGQHCPFLNRADPRCAPHLRLEKLDYAFEHCFAHYDACPLYWQLMGQRQAMRESGAPAASPRDTGSLPVTAIPLRPPSRTDPVRTGPPACRPPHEPQPVQVSVSGRLLAMARELARGRALAHRPAGVVKRHGAHGVGPVNGPSVNSTPLNSTPVNGTPVNRHAPVAPGGTPVRTAEAAVGDAPRVPAVPGV